MDNFDSFVGLTVREASFGPQSDGFLGIKESAKNRQPRKSDRFIGSAGNIDRSFTSHNNQSIKKSTVLSKVDRKDTRQSEPEAFDDILKFQQPVTVEKNDPVSSIIKKSQVDPFLRRKLKAVVDNDLKCLKKLNNQVNNVSKLVLITNSYAQSARYLPSISQNEIDAQMNRLPKDISKILNSSVPDVAAPKLKKIQSQTNIVSVLQHSMEFLKRKQAQNKAEDQSRNLTQNRSFTTLRREVYKKKLNCLEVLKTVPEMS